MPKRVIWEDKHGVFVMVDGQVFRPQLNTRFFDHAMDRRPPTMLKVGMKANVTHPLDSLWAKVNGESWCYHGNRIYWTTEDGEMKRPTEKCWNRGTG
jgi:hypothetical protein